MLVRYKFVVYIRYRSGDHKHKTFTFQHAADKERDAWNRKYRLQRGAEGSAFVIKERA